LPELIINLEKIRFNTEKIVKMTKDRGIQLFAVTKAFCGMPEVAEKMIEGGAYGLADSRIENLKKLMHLKVPKMLLRIPMISEAELTVTVSDISLNSEINTIKMLDKAAGKQKKIHKIILMIDLGDLREGILPHQLNETIRIILGLDHIMLEGIGTNLTCYGGILPTVNNLSYLVKLSQEVETKFGLKLNVISGGNSSSLYLIENNEMPKEINQLRIGEAIIFGRETAFGKQLDGLFSDVCILSAEVIELKTKGSVPIGTVGMNAFGKKPFFKDLGLIKRGILAIGEQDVSFENLVPIDAGIKLLGASSDHLIADFSKSEKNYAMGDKVEFMLNYKSLLQSCSSNYVKKTPI